jgi:hypothetical protein
MRDGSLAAKNQCCSKPAGGSEIFEVMQKQRAAMHFPVDPVKPDPHGYLRV